MVMIVSVELGMAADDFEEMTNQRSTTDVPAVTFHQSSNR